MTQNMDDLMAYRRFITQ